jgi:hypothetical protein
MPTTIKLKNSVTTTNTPTSLVQGEVAINITDKKVWVGNAATTPIQLLGDGGSASFTSLSLSGNLTFTGTGNRILGDFSNATAINRVCFQTSTTNGNTAITAFPNGTGTVAQYTAYASEPTTLGIVWGTLQVDSTAVQIRSRATGSTGFVPLIFTTSDSERLRIDTSGNVGIGTSSPSSRLHVATSSAEVARFASSATNGGYQIFFPDNITAVYIGSQKAILATGNAADFAIVGTGANNMVFGTNSTERMRIDSSGNVGIGTSSPSSLGKLSVDGNVVFGPFTRNQADTRSIGIYTSGDPASNDRAAIGFTTTAGGSSSDSYITFSTNNYGVSGGERMRITSGGEVYIAGTTDQGAYNLQCNGTGVWGAGAYVNGSDERIKDDITPLDSGLDVVAKLNPVTYKYKEDWSKDQSIQTGFIAQELLTALEGKNYVDGVVQQGGQYMSVAYQNIIPILTKAIQEQQTFIENLTTRLNALEGN